MDIELTDNQQYISVSNTGVIRVCLCDCPHNNCDLSVPLYRLRDAVLSYLGHMESEGKLQVEILYEDPTDQIIKPLFDKTQDSIKGHCTDTVT